MLLELPQAVAAHGEGIGVDLEVKSSVLGGQTFVGRIRHDLGSDGRRMPRVVEQKDLLLRTQPRDPGLDHPLLNHAIEGADVRQQPAGVGPQDFGVVDGTNRAGAHVVARFLARVQRSAYGSVIWHRSDRHP